MRHRALCYRTLHTVLCIIIVLLVGLTDNQPNQTLHAQQSADSYRFPDDNVKDDVNVFVALRLIPTTQIKPGEQLIIEIYAENSGTDKSSNVLVDLFYEEYQLVILDSHFERPDDYVSRMDYERPEITFDKLRGGERTKGQLITRVRDDVPPSSEIKVWAEWQWDYEEYNLWDVGVVERRFKEATREVRIPVVLPATHRSVPQPDQGAFVFNIGQPQNEQHCFPETGYCIGGRMREFWEYNGGMEVFGFPIGPQKRDWVEGQQLDIQWFERTRLELHPERLRPDDVMVGRVGAEMIAFQGRDWTLFAKSSPHPECRYFAETGYNVCGEILHRWRAGGLERDGILGFSEEESIALFGLPLSNLQIETLSDGSQYPVQWFERARFELHPKQFPPYNVMLGLLGRELQE